MNQQNLNGYIVISGTTRTKVHAVDMYAAKKKAIAILKVPKSKQHMVSVYLAEKAGKPVEQALA